MKNLKLLGVLLLTASTLSYASDGGSGGAPKAKAPQQTHEEWVASERARMDARIDANREGVINDMLAYEHSYIARGGQVVGEKTDEWKLYIGGAVALFALYRYGVLSKVAGAFSSAAKEDGVAPPCTPVEEGELDTVETSA